MAVFKLETRNAYGRITRHLYYLSSIKKGRITSYPTKYLTNNLINVRKTYCFLMNNFWLLYHRLNLLSYWSKGSLYTDGRIIYLDELCSILRPQKQITIEYWSRLIMRLVPVFTLKTDKQTNKKFLPKFVQTLLYRNGQCT